MLSKRCVSTTHHGVLIYTPQKHILLCVILRTKGVLGEHTMVCSGNTLVFTVYTSGLYYDFQNRHLATWLSAFQEIK